MGWRDGGGREGEVGGFDEGVNGEDGASFALAGGAVAGVGYKGWGEEGVYGDRVAVNYPRERNIGVEIRVSVWAYRGRSEGQAYR